MKFINENGINHSATKLVQADNIRVSTHRGHTLQNVIDNITRECENVSNPNTIKVTNKVNEFTIGQGVDIDVSGDVENSEVSFELEGQTYQNLIDSFYTIQSDTIKQDDNYIFNKEETQVAGGGIVWNVKFIKPTTTYTFIFKMEEISDIKWFQTDTHENYITKDVVKCGRYCGFQAIKFTTKDTLNNNAKFKLSVTGNSSFNTFKILKNVVLLEGDHTETPIETLSHYFTGIKSSFEDGNVSIKIEGKNLFDKNRNDIQMGQALGQHNGSYNDPKLFASGLIKVIPNEYYSFTHVKWGWLVDKNGNKYRDCDTSNTLKIPENCGYIRVTGSISSIDKIQVEKGSKVSDFEDYYKRVVSFNITEPLRRLPNGICDEIRNNNGQWELVRRVKKLTFNGNESWAYHSLVYESKEGVRCILDINDLKPVRAEKSLQLLCDKLNIGHDSPAFLDVDNSINAIFQRNDLNRAALYIIIMMSDCGVNSGDSSNEKAIKVKKWLNSNPVTVYYELKTPVITKIKPIKSDIKPLANVAINSITAPISKHTVILNRSGQIEQGIVQIAELRNRVSKLETAYETHLLETQLKLSLLGLEYALEKEGD